MNLSDGRATLVLVDLENMLSRWGETPGIGAPPPLPLPSGGRLDQIRGAWLAPRTHAIVPPLNPGGPVAVVVLAISAWSVELPGRPPPDLSWAWDLCRALAGAVGASELRSCELALVPSAPQAADGALLRLLVHAPSPTGAIQPDRVVLVARDGGLETAVRDRLCVPANVPLPRTIQPHLRAWASTGGPLVDRRYQPVSASDAVPCPPQPAFSARIDDEPKAAWASTQPVGLRVACDLFDLVRLAASEPHLFSQFGPTGATVRGVSRLGPTFRATVPTLGPVSPADGLEIHAGLPSPRGKPVGSVEVSPIAAGLLRLPDHCATIQCRVPASVVRDVVAARPPADPLRVDRVATLTPPVVIRLAATGRRLGDVVTVRLAGRGATRCTLTAVVATRYGSPVRSWWVDASGVCSSERRLPCAFGPPLAEVRVQARWRRSPLGHLDLVFSTPGLSRVHLSAGVAAGGLAVGRVGRQDAVVWAAEGGIEHGAEVPCVAIQEWVERAPVAAVEAAQRRIGSSALGELRRLPVLVPSVRAPLPWAAGDLGETW